MLHSSSRAKVVSDIWVVASLLVLFAGENVWIDPWLGNKSCLVPSLTLGALSGLWFLALLVVTFCVLLIVAKVLVTLDRGISLRKRIGTGLATFLAVLLCVLWACVTSGMTSGPTFGKTFREASKGHSVTLTWKASKSAVKGYNVYRGTRSGGPYTKINSVLVAGLTYVDQDVPRETTYYYVIRAVDADGRESANSTEITVKVP
jgi:4-amino-4-deoxy-L-arabinose transferase-like glycosyltransferase